MTRGSSPRARLRERTSGTVTLGAMWGLPAVQRTMAAGGVGTGCCPRVYRASVATNGPPPGTMCESCGRDDDALETVRRVYLEADDAGNLGPARPVPGVERWCGACRALYPHEPARG